MRKEAGLISGFTLVTAAVAFFVRWVQHGAIFEEDTGLVTVGSLWSVVLIVLYLFAAAAIGFLCVMLSRCKPNLEARAALMPKKIFMLAQTVIGALMAVCGVMLMFTAKDYSTPALTIMLGVLAIAAGLSTALLPNGIHRMAHSIPLCIAGALPIVFYCFWLVYTYKEQSANPVIWQFAFDILAIAASAVAAYYLAGYVFGRPRPRLTVFALSISPILCAVPIADEKALPIKALFILTLICNTISAANIVLNIEDNGEKLI